MKNKHILLGLSRSFFNLAIRFCSNATTFLQCCPKFWAQQRNILLCFILLLLLGASAEAQNALPSDATTPSRELSSPQYLCRDWGGERRPLAANSITFDFFY